MESQTANRIQRLNDAFRKSLSGGRVVLTASVAALDSAPLERLLTLVTGFTDFNKDNDPYGEHDFGAVTFEGDRYFWKIDYYDTNFSAGSPDPTDERVTGRVLTVMRADEY